MKNIFGFFCFALAIFCSSCDKDDPVVQIYYPEPGDSVHVYVPIYQPGDTTYGAGYAQKLDAGWKAQVIYKTMAYFDTNYVSLTFLTYAVNGAVRESFGFYLIPKLPSESIYGLREIIGTPLPGFIGISYGTWTSDGDVLEDRYSLDTTATDNSFAIKFIAPDRVEGTFTATFNAVEPRRNVINPKRVKFSNGKFWAVLQD